uniref:Uncharacterized protein n=1 Tax=Rhizochromulina marina TaxID=1034831 RepID=A0A7S2WRR5_9STRA
MRCCLVRYCLPWRRGSMSKDIELLVESQCHQASSPEFAVVPAHQLHSVLYATTDDFVPRSDQGSRRSSTATGKSWPESADDLALAGALRNSESLGALHDISEEDAKA